MNTVEKLQSPFLSEGHEDMLDIWGRNQKRLGTAGLVAKGMYIYIVIQVGTLGFIFLHPCQETHNKLWRGKMPSEVYEVYSSIQVNPTYTVHIYLYSKCFCY